MRGRKTQARAADLARKTGATVKMCEHLDDDGRKCPRAGTHGFGPPLIPAEMWTCQEHQPENFRRKT